MATTATTMKPAKAGERGRHPASSARVTTNRTRSRVGGGPVPQVRASDVSHRQKAAAISTPLGLMAPIRNGVIGVTASAAPAMSPPVDRPRPGARTAEVRPDAMSAAPISTLMPRMANRAGWGSSSRDGQPTST